MRGLVLLAVVAAARAAATISFAPPDTVPPLGPRQGRSLTVPRVQPIGPLNLHVPAVGAPAAGALGSRFSNSRRPASGGGALGDIQAKLQEVSTSLANTQQQLMG